MEQAGNVSRQRKQKLVATRLNPSQRAAVFAVAEAEGRSVSSLLRALVLPEVGRRLAALSADKDGIAA